jgi:hypothetical protein
MDSLPLLSARLWNLASVVGSVHIGIFDQYYDPNNQNNSNQPNQPPPPKTGTPIIASTDPTVDPTKGLVLFAESMTAEDLDTSLEARVAMAGTRGGDPRPATVFLTALNESTVASTAAVLPGLFRPEATWVVLYIGATLDPDDPNDADDVAAAVKSHATGFLVSALTLDKASCTFEGITPPQETNKNGEPQRNLEMKLAELTGGAVGSFCPKTYSLFMDDFASQGTGTEYFPVTLPASVQASSIQISADGVPIKSFSYIPGTTTLMVSTLIQPGESFSVTAVPDTPLPAAVVSTDPGDPNVPEAGNTTLPPDEQAFLTNVEPVLQNDCGGCHAGRPFDTNGGYASAETNKAEIARRIQLPATDPDHMPQGGSLSDADKTQVLNWANM